MQRLTKARELKPLEALQRADPQKLARFLEGEHPQTIALVLGQLGDRQASALLMSLPNETRSEAVKRLANSENSRRKWRKGFQPCSASGSSKLENKASARTPAFKAC